MRNAGGLNTIRKNILNYYRDVPISDEIKMVINFLKKNPLKLFPYSFPEKYNSSLIKVYDDKEKNLRYVFHEGKRMYFKRSWQINDIRENYTNLLIEQDKNSPHRYLTGNFTVGKNEVVADIGAAEGIFSLSVIEHVKKIYLFETDSEWIEALQATFMPWNDKIEIINKFVSDKNDIGNITLDKFATGINVLFDFIKIDVDGAELRLLAGCRKILSSTHKIKIAICTYHKAGDEISFRNVLKDYGFSICPSSGYMIFYHDPYLSAPFLRRGLLRASK